MNNQLPLSHENESGNSKNSRNSNRSSDDDDNNNNNSSNNNSNSNLDLRKSSTPSYLLMDSFTPVNSKKATPIIELSDKDNYKGNNNDNDNDPHSKKRNRISFVCQACRKSKTKCDREKPECTRCVKQHIKCIYDVAKQPRPRIPNKDATIAKLERDVSYWQNKAMKLLNQQQETVNNIKKRTYSSRDNLSESVNNITLNSNDNNATNDNNNKNSTYPSSSKRLRSPNDNNGGPRFISNTNKFTQKTRNINDNDDDSLNDIEINLYKDHPTLIFSKVMKHDIKPLSENYIIIQDKFISSCIASAFLSPSGNSMIPALTANVNISRAQPSVRNNVTKLKEMLIAKCNDPVQRERINEFTDRILQNTHSSRNLKVGMILSMLYNTIGHQYLEDHCQSNGEYSELLQTFIKEFESLLPPYEIIQKYKKHFISYVYPNLPFLQKEMFEESINQCLFVDEDNPQRIKLKLGNTHIRDKIENLSILLVLLKLSYISLRYITDKNNQSGEADTFITQEQLDQYPIPNEFILLAQRCLASENWCACSNENIITCLLYIWSYFAFSPEEGDFFLEHPTDIISSLIMMLSTSIGLHRDPDDFPQLKDPSLSDPRLLNHRRLLWVSVVGICAFESTLKGRHPLISADLMSSFLDTSQPNAVKHYMERVLTDRTDSDDNMMLALHEFTVKRAQLSLLLSDLDNVTMSYNNTFSLRYLELSREKIEIFMEENFPLVEIDKKNYKKSKVSKNKEKNTKLQSVLLVNQNSNALQSRIISKLMFLRTSAAIVLHFELKAKEDKSFLPYYFKYLIQSCIDALNLAKFFNDFLSGQYSNFVYKGTYYNVTKVIQLALPSALFSLISIIIKLTLASNTIFAEYQASIQMDGTSNIPPERSSELNFRFEHISFLQRELEASLVSVYEYSSQSLRFTYFSVFKLFAVGDVILQRITKGEIWSGILQLAHHKNFHSRLVKNLRMTLGVEVDKGEELIRELKELNHLNEIPMDDLIRLCQEVYNINQTIIPVGDNEDNKSDSVIPSTIHQFSPNIINNRPKQEHVAESNNRDQLNHNNTPIPSEPISSYPNSSSGPSMGTFSENKISPVPSVNPFNYISALNNLQKLSSAATLPQNMDYQSKLKNNSLNDILNRNAIQPRQVQERLFNNSQNNNNNYYNNSIPAFNITGSNSNSINISNNLSLKSTNSDKGTFCNNNINVPSGANNNGQMPPNIDYDPSGDMNNVPTHSNNPPSNNESIANNFVQRTKGPSTAEYPGYFGGLDLFDYDFLFGNDFS